MGTLLQTIVANQTRRGMAHLRLTKHVVLYIVIIICATEKE